MEIPPPVLAQLDASSLVIECRNNGGGSGSGGTDEGGSCPEDDETAPYDHSDVCFSRQRRAWNDPRFWGVTWEAGMVAGAIRDATGAAHIGYFDTRRRPRTPSTRLFGAPGLEGSAMQPGHRRAAGAQEAQGGPRPPRKSRRRRGRPATAAGKWNGMTTNERKKRADRTKIQALNGGSSGRTPSARRPSGPPPPRPRRARAASQLPRLTEERGVRRIKLGLVLAPVWTRVNLTEIMASSASGPATEAFASAAAAAACARTRARPSLLFCTPEMGS